MGSDYDHQESRSICDGSPEQVGATANPPDGASAPYRADKRRREFPRAYPVNIPQTDDEFEEWIVDRAPPRKRGDIRPRLDRPRLPKPSDFSQERAAKARPESDD